MNNVCTHSERPVKARGMCGSCYQSYLKNRSPEIREKTLKKERTLVAKRKAAMNAEERSEYYRYQKNRVLRYRYGIDLDVYTRMHIEQQNKCAVCSAEGGNTRATRLYVDHNHTTGAVRQLLCPGCNQAMGIVEQGIDRIKTLASYLLKHEPTSEAWNALAKLDLYLREQ